MLRAVVFCFIALIARTVIGCTAPPVGCTLPNCFNPAFASIVPHPPQFVVMSHDDAVTDVTWSQLIPMTRCSAPITFFVTQEGTIPEHVKVLHDNGDEIALHTVHHQHLNTIRGDALYNEIFGVRDFLTNVVGIPHAELVGFRAPYLETSTDVRQKLFVGTDIQWESTYNVGISDPMWNGGAKVWPFTLDSGTVLKNKTTIASEMYPGRWEIPLIAVAQDGVAAYAMNPGEYVNATAPGGRSSISDIDLTKLLMKNFQDSYIGNRSPFGIHFHTPWLANPGYASVLDKFIKYATGLADVRFVTMSQLVEWMKNPINYDQMPPVDHAKCVNLIDPPPAPPMPSSTPSPSHAPSTSRGVFLDNKGLFVTLIVIFGPMVIVAAVMLFVAFIRLF